MTEKRNIIYLTLKDIEDIYRVLVKRFEGEEPLPPFSSVNKEHLDALIKLPQSEYFGDEQYPSLASKTAIIFYTINKKHLFINGNKRLSVVCMLVFLELNGYTLSVTQEELTEKAIWLAKTAASDFMSIKELLEKWLEDNLRTLND